MSRLAIMRIWVPLVGLLSKGPKNAVGLTTTAGTPSRVASRTAFSIAALDIR